MTEEQEKRFNECIKSLPHRNHETAVNPPEGEIPEKPARNEQIEQLKLINKNLSMINKELHAINNNLKSRR